MSSSPSSPPSKRPPCKKEACAIQACLNKNKFDPEKCQRQIQRMVDCCKAIQYQSYICDGFNPEKIAETQKREKLNQHES